LELSFRPAAFAGPRFAGSKRNYRLDLVATQIGTRLTACSCISSDGSLEEDWRAHGKKVFPVLREKHPQAYFGGLVALSKVIKWDAAETEMFDKTLSPEEIVDKLEQRVGPEGRRTAASGLATTWQSVPTYLRPAWKQDFAYA
jgi:hypothetical protein